MKKCRHLWKMNSYTGWNEAAYGPRPEMTEGEPETGLKPAPTVPCTLTFRCTLCGQQQSRVATMHEQTHLARNWDTAIAVHKVWHEWVQTDKAAIGAVRMDQWEAFAARHPQDVILCRTDDSYHTGSYVALVAHRTERHWMGVTMVTVPQVSPDKDEAFLYPNALCGLIEGLQQMQKLQDETLCRQKEDADADALEVSTWKP